MVEWYGCPGRAFCLRLCFMRKCPFNYTLTMDFGSGLQIDQQIWKAHTCWDTFGGVIQACGRLLSQLTLHHTMNFSKPLIDFSIHCVREYDVIQRNAFEARPVSWSCTCLPLLPTIMYFLTVLIVCYSFRRGSLVLVPTLCLAHSPTCLLRSCLPFRACSLRQLPLQLKASQAPEWSLSTSIMQPP